MQAPLTSAREAAIQIIRTLRQQGHVAYLAGGCVRDRLLGLDPVDYDVATDATPQAVQQLFRGARLVGEAFGVVLVRLMHHEVEVATFRNEWGYDDGRRPSHVEFTDARNDALRRDFTINGLFEDPLAPADQQVIDFVGGRADLERRIIRAIGNPQARFAEDFLRMLRAVRFAARLGFVIEEATAAAIRDHAADLARISRERIGQEIAFMLNASSRAQAVGLIQNLGLDAPTLSEKHRPADLATLAALPPSAPLAPALAAWILDRHLSAGCAAAGGQTPAAQAAAPKSEEASLTQPINRFIQHEATAILTDWRTALCLSNDDLAMTQATLLLLPRALAWPKLGVAAQKRLLAEEAWAYTLLVLCASQHWPGVGPVLTIIDAEMPMLYSQGVSPKPWITGNDLIALGRKPGPEFKRLLDVAYDSQLDGTFKDRQAGLDWLMRQP